MTALALRRNELVQCIFLTPTQSELELLLLCHTPYDSKLNGFAKIGEEAPE